MPLWHLGQNCEIRRLVPRSGCDSNQRRDPLPVEEKRAGPTGDIHGSVRKQQFFCFDEDRAQSAPPELRKYIRLLPCLNIQGTGVPDIVLFLYRIQRLTMRTIWPAILLR